MSEKKAMKIALGSDHHGAALRAKIATLLADLGGHAVDMGTCGEVSVDYPDVAVTVGHAVRDGACQRGILICSSGIGMAVAANKIHAIRATPCYDERMAEMSRRHNDANVLCLSDDMVGHGRNLRIVEIWLATPFDGGRHERRVAKITALESNG